MKKLIAIIMLVFLLGWLSNNVYSYINDNQFPYSKITDKISPNDHIKQDQIKATSDTIIINVKEAYVAGFVDSNSMDPILDASSNGIEVIPNNPEQLNIGDIIAYEASWTSGIVIHRIIFTGYDEQGWYAITKGDNNSIEDPERVRFTQVKYLLIGIIY